MLAISPRKGSPPDLIRKASSTPSRGTSPFAGSPEVFYRQDAALLSTAMGSPWVLAAAMKAAWRNLPL